MRALVKPLGRQFLLKAIFAFTFLTQSLSDYVPNARYGSVHALINKRIYFIGGYSSNTNQHLTDTFYLDLTTNFTTDSLYYNFSLLSYVPRFSVANAVLDPKDNQTIFAFSGGVGPGNNILATNDFYIIEAEHGNTTIKKNSSSPTPQSWPTARSDCVSVIDQNDDPNTPTTRFDYTATMLSDGRILFIGGSKDDPAKVKLELTDIDVYDTISGTWSKITAQNPLGLVRRAGHSATLAPDNQTIIVFGGSPTPINSFNGNGLAILHLANFTWSQPSPPNPPSRIPFFHTATLFNNYIIFAFGKVGNSSINDVNILDILDHEYQWVTNFDPNVNRVRIVNNESAPTSNGVENPHAVSNHTGVLVVGALASVVVLAVLVAFSICIYRTDGYLFFPGLACCRRRV